MTEQEKKILAEIIARDGACLDSKRCQSCPFREKCLPEFIRPKGRPSKARRLSMALDALTYLGLFDEQSDWRQKEK